MISIHLENSITFLETSPFHSIGSLKSMIQSQNSIPIQSIKLIFQGKVLQNNLTLQDYNIVPGSALLLIKSPENMQVIVKLFKGRSYTFDVGPHDSFKHLKEKIQIKTSIPASHQRLFIPNKFSDDSDLIFNSGIKNLDVIGLMYSAPKQITVINERNEVFKIDILNDKSIKDLKRLIAGRVGIPDTKMFICCVGKKLNDGDLISSLRKCEVFVCKEKNQQVHLKFSQGEIRTFHCDDETSIRGVIKEIKKVYPLCQKEYLKIGDDCVDDELRKVCEVSRDKILNIELRNFGNLSTNETESNPTSVLNFPDTNYSYLSVIPQ